MLRDILWLAYDTAVDRIYAVLPRDTSPQSLIPALLSLFAIYATFLSFLSTARFAIRTTWLFLKWGVILSSLFACVGLWNDDPTTKKALSSAMTGATSLGSLAYSFAADSGKHGSGRVNGYAQRRKSNSARSGRSRRGQRTTSGANSYDPYAFRDPLDRRGASSDDNDLGSTVKSFINQAMHAYGQQRGDSGASTARDRRRRAGSDDGTTGQPVDWSGLAWSAMRGDWKGAYDQVVGGNNGRDRRQGTTRGARNRA